jgi:hypothetical protein
VRRGVGSFAVVLLVGAVVGSVVGEVLARLLPNGFLHSLFGRGISIGIPHFSVNLVAFTLSFGLMMRVNLCTLAGAAIAVLVWRR